MVVTLSVALFPFMTSADHIPSHPPCNEPDTVGGGTLGVSPGAGLGWDVGGGQCNGSFSVTSGSFVDGSSIELGLRAEQRREGQVARGAGNNYEVETGPDTTLPIALNRAWWNFQGSVAYTGVPAVDAFFNGFEVDTTCWESATRFASGGGTIGAPSATGSWHAEVAGGAFTRWGGYDDSVACGATAGGPFPANGYDTAIDIYLDVDGGFANDSRFDFSSAINGTTGTHRRDFIFSCGFYDDADGPGAGTDRFVCSASNNSPGWPKNPDREPTVVASTTGWYTLLHQFRDNGSGVLTVDLSVLDSGGTVIKTWTLSDPTDVIGTTVGGNRYGWFVTVAPAFGVLAVDNSRRTNVVDPISTLDSLTLSINTVVGPNVPTAPVVDLLALRGIIDDRNTNGTSGFDDLYQFSQNPEFGWFAPASDTDANPSAFDYDVPGAWLFTLTAVKGAETAKVTACIHTPGEQCAINVNDLVTLTNQSTSYNSSTKVFTIMATWENTGDGDIVNPYLEVAILSGSACPCLVIGDAPVVGGGGVGTQLPLDGNGDLTLSPGETTTREIKVQLTKKKPFNFFVDFMGEVP